VAFNPVKEGELCSISSDGVAKFWDVKTKSATNTVTGLGEAFTLAWCPDGESVIVGNKVGKLHTLACSRIILVKKANGARPTISMFCPQRSRHQFHLTSNQCRQIK